MPLAEDSDLERTEAPSSRRIEKAREEGNVPQSRELMAFLVMASALGGLWALGSWMSSHAIGIMRHGLTFGRDAGFDTRAMGNMFVDLSWEALTLVAPIFVLTVVAALLTPFLLGGWVFSPTAMTPNFARLDPVAGFKRMFSTQAAGELVKAILKAVLIGAISWWVVRHEEDALFALIGQQVDAAMVSTTHMLLFAAAALLGGLAIIAAFDVPFQLWQYYSRLRMTKEEVRQEYKEMEGDPQLKARIRSQQRQMARRRMMAEVPKAQVVVTNPSHFAVALRYEGDMAAPQVVAKGMNAVAQKIRELAEENDVPIVEAPPLARALYRHAEIGDQIPATLYTAVAEVMAYVYQLNQFLTGGGKLLPPQVPTAIAVPAGMDPGAVE
ncbi:MAG TPA: flagellar biosynthesis protein FlhB [Rhodocyclaceae bacterium]